MIPVSRSMTTRVAKATPTSGTRCSWKIRVSDRQRRGQRFVTVIRKGRISLKPISPGSHVTKRRARSGPLSMDLLESVHRTGLPAPNLVRHSSVLSSSYLISLPQKPKKSNNAITFPTIPRSHSRSGSQSSTSSSRRSSPLPPNRVNADARLHLTASRIPGASRLPLSCLESAGTLLFGPTIPADASAKSTAVAMSPAVTVNLCPWRARLRLPQRHSYAGPGTGLSFNDMTQHRLARKLMRRMSRKTQILRRRLQKETEPRPSKSSGRKELKVT